MPTVNANGVRLHYQEEGSGEPVVLVHGSWGSADNWLLLSPLLAADHRVVAYDRRGHSRSERPPGQGSIHQDVEDLAALVRALVVAPCHLVGNSWGAIISLRCSAKYPDLFRSVHVHEPPAFRVLEDVPAAAEMLRRNDVGLAAVHDLLDAGKEEESARTFFETIAIGPGAWDMFPDVVRQRILENVPTFHDELHDPEQITFDLDLLKLVSRPFLLTRGTESPEALLAIADTFAGALPDDARFAVIEGTGHTPHLTHAEQLAALLRDHWAEAR